MKLYHQNTVLAENVIEAKTFIQRGIGLLGRSSFPDDSTLWIKPCNNIHTCFMKFEMDAIFVDRELRVVRVIHNMKPYRFILYVPKAASVFEFYKDVLKNKVLNHGDQLHVGT